MRRQWYDKTKPMTPLNELAERLEYQNDLAGSGTSKGKQKESEVPKEPPRPMGLENVVKPKSQERRIKHSQRVHFELDRYFQTVAEQEEEERYEADEATEEDDTVVQSSISEGVKRKRSPQERETSLSDDSLSGPSNASESRRNIPYSGGQLADGDIKKETEETLKGLLDSQFGSGDLPQVRMVHGASGNRGGTPQTPPEASKDSRRQ